MTRFYTGNTQRVRQALIEDDLTFDDLCDELPTIEPHKIRKLLKALLHRGDVAIVRDAPKRYKLIGSAVHLAHTPASMAASALYAPILAALAAGPLDTEQIRVATGIGLDVLPTRLARLRDAGLTEGAGRRPSSRSRNGNLMVWRIKQARPHDPVPADHRAGRIVHGRGSRWWAGLA